VDCRSGVEDQAHGVWFGSPIQRSKFGLDGKKKGGADGTGARPALRVAGVPFHLPPIVDEVGNESKNLQPPLFSSKNFRAPLVNIFHAE